MQHARLTVLLAATALLAACASPAPAPERFHLRPEVEKAYGYTHAIRIGDEIKVSGAVSMDDAGNPTATRRR